VLCLQEPTHQTRIDVNLRGWHGLRLRHLSIVADCDSCGTSLG
jgi:hypothetical protein